MNAVFPPWPIREFRDRSDGIPESGREDSIFRGTGAFFGAHKVVSRCRAVRGEKTGHRHCPDGPLCLGRRNTGRSDDERKTVGLLLPLVPHGRRLKFYPQGSPPPSQISGQCGENTSGSSSIIVIITDCVVGEHATVTTPNHVPAGISVRCIAENQSGAFYPQASSPIPYGDIVADCAPRADTDGGDP